MFFLSLAVLYILALLPSRACDHVTDGSSLSLFVCVCASQSVVKIFMCAECSQILKPKATMESESVEREHRREKTPRRVIHFSSGETMEEYSTDEEEEDRQPERRDLLSPSVEAGRVSELSCITGLGKCVYCFVCVCMCVCSRRSTLCKCLLI